MTRTTYIYAVGSSLDPAPHRASRIGGIVRSVGKLFKRSRSLDDLTLCLGIWDSQLPQWSIIIGLIPGVGQVGELGFWLENIAALGAAFLDFFRNKDDKVTEHSYAWNYDLANSMARDQTSLLLDFNGGGGGHHAVLVQFTEY
ncbi:hypothetical protein BGZ63DRAFT_373047 [Mariannaea sp. PMI_226]|nr:hypothetical protein BGZ63DRAFT_373047 [Mariannaea sp. PMI_226]